MSGVSIWYETPQWQIEVFRQFQIPDELIEKHQYQPLTRRVKEQVFGFNSARVFWVDVEMKRLEVPNGALGRLRMSHQEEGLEPSKERMAEGCDEWAELVVSSAHAGSM